MTHLKLTVAYDRRLARCLIPALTSDDAGVSPGQPRQCGTGHATRVL